MNQATRLIAALAAVWTAGVWGTAAAQEATRPDAERIASERLRAQAAQTRRDEIAAQNEAHHARRRAQAAQEEERHLHARRRWNAAHGNDGVRPHRPEPTRPMAQRQQGAPQRGR